MDPNFMGIAVAIFFGLRGLKGEVTREIKDTTEPK